MKNLSWIYFLLFFLCFSFCGLVQVNSQLIPVKAKNKFGYIDSSGKMTIPAKFYAAQPFSEGLAAVRENGYYGYINNNGIYVIAPQYDFAESFSGGIARIYNDGSSKFIDKSKKIIFEVPSGIKEMTPFKNEISVARGNNGYVGLMNNMGQLTIDTIYYSLKDLSNNQFIACRFDPSKGDTLLVNDYWYGSDNLNYPPDYGVINSFGDTLIKFGKYIKITKGGDSTFICRGFKSIKHYFIDIYNSDFQMVYSYEDDLPFFSEFSFETGKYIVSRPNYEYGMDKGYSHDVLITKKGKIILDNPDFEEIRVIAFTDKMFVRIKGKSFGENTFYRLVNLKGEFLDDIRYKSILDDETFDNPLLVFYDIDGIKTEYIKDCWCILNPDLSITTIDEFCGRGWGFQIEHKKNIYLVTDSEENGQRYGWSKTLKGIGAVKLPLTTEPIIWEGESILISSSTDTSEIVYNSDGRLIYAVKDKYKKYKYNFDKMIRMRFQVHGWDYWLIDGGTDWNTKPQKDTFNTIDFITITSEVNNNIGYHYAHDIDKFLERKIIVSNKSKEDTMILTTVGKHSELVLIIEAFHQENKTWMPITVVDDKKNSLVKKLLPGDCWQLFIPEMKGGISTYLRVKVEIFNHKTGKPEYLYSKPYLGSINPGQFWRIDHSDEFWSCPENKFRTFDEW